MDGAIKIIPSEVAQTQKDKYSMHLRIHGS